MKTALVIALLAAVPSIGFAKPPTTAPDPYIEAFADAVAERRIAHRRGLEESRRVHLATQVSAKARSQLMHALASQRTPAPAPHPVVEPVIAPAVTAPTPELPVN
ncbi:MAG: hypothetical protein AAF654_10065 [Myxococcota bacterium]